MKNLLGAIFILSFGASAHAQKACAFTEKTKPRHDQYSQSPKQNIDKSKKEMDDQSSEFDKKKYQAEVKNKAVKKRKTVPRYM